MVPGIPIELTFIYHLLVAIGLGALIGVERELHIERESVLVGIRTFPLVAIVGFVLAYLTNLSLDTITGINSTMLFSFSIGLTVITAFAIALLFVRFRLGEPGFTTPLAFVVTYVIGILVGYSLLIEAVVIGVVTTFLLASKEHLHAFASLLSAKELIGALQFITIAFILYPLMVSVRFSPPFDIFSPGGALDFSTILLIVIFVSSLSFVSFLVIRWQGPRRGLRFSGLLGGLVNSEAATASLCEQQRKTPGIVDAVASGIILANATMFIRNLVVVAFADPSLATVRTIALPLLLLSALGIILGFGMRVVCESNQVPEVRSPFSIGFALRFAAIFLIVSAGTLLIRGYLGQDVVYVIAVGAFVSSAAVSASIASLAALGQISPMVAGETILIACAISSINKLVITRAISRPVMERAKWQMVLISGAAFISAILLLALGDGI